jgi:hypothetical protein
VSQIVITEAGRRTREGQSQEQIADKLRPAIEAVLDDLDRWLALATKLGPAKATASPGGHQDAAQMKRRPRRCSGAHHSLLDLLYG